MTSELTPSQIAGATFRMVRKGYAREEVEAFLNDVAGALEAAQQQATAMEARARAAVAIEGARSRPWWSFLPVRGRLTSAGVLGREPPRQEGVGTETSSRVIDGIMSTAGSGGAESALGMFSKSSVGAGTSW